MNAFIWVRLLSTTNVDDMLLGIIVVADILLVLIAMWMFVEIYRSMKD